ncbi:MAG: hypothetical protein JWN29_1732, partial [Acidimicrobiales bacterium]|nr:hypothetical protein [Acidimicrobiales bacterium]
MCPGYRALSGVPWRTLLLVVLPAVFLASCSDEDVNDRLAVDEAGRTALIAWE